MIIESQPDAAARTKSWTRGAPLRGPTPDAIVLATAPRVASGLRTFARFALAVALVVVSAGSARATTLFGLVDTGELYASSDEGASWAIRATLPVHDGVALGAGATSSKLFLVTRSGSLYASSDAGSNWTPVGAVSAGDVADLLVRADLSLLALSASGALYRSTDGGASFTALAALTAPDFVSLAQTLPNQVLYALTRSGGVYQSTDGGQNWAGTGAFSAPDAVKLCARGLTLCALTGAGDVYSSTDAGSSWDAVGTLSQVGMTSLAWDGSNLLASTSAGEVAASGNGAAWLWKGAIGQLTVTALGVDTPAATGVEPSVTNGILQFATPWPNPARNGSAATLAFRLPRSGAVTIELYDLAGRRVARRAAETFPAGETILRWNAPVGGAGIYLVKLGTESGTASKRWVVLE